MRLLIVVAAALLATPAFAAAPVPTPLPHSPLVIDTSKGRVRLDAEVAADDRSRMRGLMYRTYLAPNAGMLFEFPADGFRNFWMKNTVLSLDMIFIRADGTISSIAENTTPYSENVVSSTEPVRDVLELNAGRAAALGIRPGEKIHSAAFGNALPAQ